MKNIDRIYDILDFDETEEVIDYEVKHGDILNVYYTDVDNYTCLYKADMRERPQALRYVLGLRNTFND